METNAVVLRRENCRGGGGGGIQHYTDAQCWDMCCTSQVYRQCCMIGVCVVAAVDMQSIVPGPPVRPCGETRVDQQLISYNIPQQHYRYTIKPVIMYVAKRTCTCMCAYLRPQHSLHSHQCSMYVQENTFFGISVNKGSYIHSDN